MPEEVVPRERQGVRSGRGSRSALGSEPSAEPQRQAPVSGAWSPNLDWKPGSAIRTKEDAQGAAVYHATRAGLPPELFLSLVQQESGWNPTARSNKGAWGLGQIMPETARQPGFGVTPVRNNTPEENLRFSADYLKAMLARYDGNVPLALAAYNAGAGAVDKAGGIPNFRETQNYVRTILGQAGGGSPERGNSRAVGASRQGSPRGLDAAIRMATHFPNEVSVKDAERYANTGRLAEPQYLRDSKGGGAAVDPYNGRSLWERAATETPMTAAEQAETRLKLEEQQYKLAQQRMKTIEQVGKHAFGDDFTPQVGAMMAITMDARGIEPTQKNLSTVMHHAKRTTEAVQEKMKPLIGRGPTFRSYSVGMAAGALGLTETEAGEVVDRLVKPMQSIVGGENISEETQLHLMIGLGTVQERAGVTPAESAQMIQMAMRYGFKVSDLLQHIEQAKEQGVELTPSRYEHVLAQQTGRRHAQ
ncbi:transglycosylase SLT domain-containing protein [Allochromatium humboldtianum]|uniref:Transglycosylase SLT domain-containing protein n=2 Tax=Allochromatium humboldtianum TaxID=504901 RepID=A0A850R9S7_9GAMM|nr:transglycosylase SLT domain-containing protein [Allochromatium humboldtianum]